MQDIENVLDARSFWVALVVGLVGAAVVWFRLRGGHRDPGAPLVAVVAMLAGLRVEHRLPTQLIVGVGLLFLGEWLGRRLFVAGAVVALPGALLIGAALPDGWPSWIRVVVVAVAFVGGLLTVRTETVTPRIVLVLLAVSAGGLYLCVPDTEAVRPLLGAMLAVVVLAIDARVSPSLGASAVTGLFVYIAGIGGVGRPGSVVGGVACLGVVLLVPLLRIGTSARVMAVLVVVHCVLVAYLARVAGFEDSAWAAFALSAVGFVVAFVVLRLLPLASPRSARG